MSHKSNQIPPSIFPKSSPRHGAKWRSIFNLSPLTDSSAFSCRSRRIKLPPIEWYGKASNVVFFFPVIYFEPSNFLWIYCLYFFVNLAEEHRRWVSLGVVTPHWVWCWLATEVSACGKRRWLRGASAPRPSGLHGPRIRSAHSWIREGSIRGS